MGLRAPKSWVKGTSKDLLVQRIRTEGLAFTIKKQSRGTMRDYHRVRRATLEQIRRHVIGAGYNPDADGTYLERAFVDEIGAACETLAWKPRNPDPKPPEHSHELDASGADSQIKVTHKLRLMPDGTIKDRED